jgi:hypothetical protein
MASMAMQMKMTPTQPIPNFSLLFKTQELKSKITQASFGFPLVVKPCMYISVPEPTRQNGNGPSFLQVCSQAQDWSMASQFSVTVSVQQGLSYWFLQMVVALAHGSSGTSRQFIQQ